MIFLLFNNTKSKANTWCLHIFPLKSLWATFSKGLKDLKGRCFRAALVSTNRAQQVSLGAAQGSSWAVFTAARMLSGKPPKAFSAYLQPRAASSAHNSGAHRHTATPPSQTARAQQSPGVSNRKATRAYLPTWSPENLHAFKLAQQRLLRSLLALVPRVRCDRLYSPGQIPSPGEFPNI